MTFLLYLLGAISNTVQWFIGYGQRKLGRTEEKTDVLKADLDTIEAEKEAATQRASALDKLHNHKF